jgi:Tfp pilus assembly protein PilO
MPIKDIVEIIFSIFKTRPLKIIPRKKIILGIGLLLGIGILLYQSLLSMQLIRSRTMGFYLWSRKRLVAYQRKIIQNPRLLSSKIEGIKNKLKNLEKQFVPERELTFLFNDLKGLINNTQNDLVSLDIKPMMAMGVYHRLPFSITVKGNYADIMLLLNRLEGYAHLIDIKDIKIEPAGEGSLEVVTMSLEVESFVIKD